MKVLSLTEFMATCDKAIFSFIADYPEQENHLLTHVEEWFLKKGHVGNNHWWGMNPFDTDLLGVADIDLSEAEKVHELLSGEGETRNLPYGPGFTREEDWGNKGKVLVLEDEDIEQVLYTYMSTFPEHAKRVMDQIDKENN